MRSLQLLLCCIFSAFLIVPNNVRADQIVKVMRFVDRNWQEYQEMQFPGPQFRVRISVDKSGRAWVVLPNGSVFQTPINDNGPFVLVPNISAFDLSAGGDGSVWIIDRNDVVKEIVQSQRSRESQKREISFPGAKRISVDRDGIPWIMNKDGRVYRYFEMEDGFIEFKTATKNLEDISAGASTWIIGSDNLMYFPLVDRYPWYTIWDSNSVDTTWYSSEHKDEMYGTSYISERTNKWLTVPGFRGLAIAEGDNGKPTFVSLDHKIYQWYNNTQQFEPFSISAPLADDIALSPDGSLWITTPPIPVSRNNNSGPVTHPPVGGSRTGSGSPQVRTVCRGDTVPPGWVITTIYSVSSCPNVGTEVVPSYVIQNVSLLPSGSQIVVCANSDVPIGWETVSETTSGNCGYLYPLYQKTARVIRKKS